MRPEHPLLLGRGQPGVQRQDLGVAQLATFQHVGGVADLALAGEEDEDVAGRLRRQLVDSVGDGLQLIGVITLAQRAVSLLDGVRTAADFDDRCRTVRTAEEVSEALGVDRGRGDDDLEVAAAGEQPA